MAAPPAAPFANISTVSFVLWSPSTSIMLNDASTASDNTDCRYFCSTGTSVARKHSMVAMSGWIIPTPLAAPPSVTFRPSISVEMAISLGRVSVVIMERANSWPPSPVNLILPTFCLIRAMGSSTPIIPVLHARMSSESTPAWRAASAVISSASSSPCGPTQQLAHPLLATTPLAEPLRTRSRLSVTDGDKTRLEEKVPATLAGPSDSRSPRSSVSCS